jgi:hypothetical protein
VDDCKSPHACGLELLLIHRHLSQDVVLSEEIDGPRSPLTLRDAASCSSMGNNTVLKQSLQSTGVAVRITLLSRSRCIPREGKTLNHSHAAKTQLTSNGSMPHH